MIRIFVWDGMDGKKSIWMMFRPIQQLQDFHTRNHMTMEKTHFEKPNWLMPRNMWPLENVNDGKKAS